MSATVCKNCGLSITLVPYSMGPKWMHNPPGYTGMKTAGGAYNVYEHCRGMVAEPPAAVVLSEGETR